MNYNLSCLKQFKSNHDPDIELKVRKIVLLMKIKPMKEKKVNHHNLNCLQELI